VWDCARFLRNTLEKAYIRLHAYTPPQRPSSSGGEMGPFSLAIAGPPWSVHIKEIRRVKHHHADGRLVSHIRPFSVISQVPRGESLRSNPRRFMFSRCQATRLCHRIATPLASISRSALVRTFSIFLPTRSITTSLLDDPPNSTRLSSIGRPCRRVASCMLFRNSPHKHSFQGAFGRDYIRLHGYT
jgi:hypothetical protein